MSPLFHRAGVGTTVALAMILATAPANAQLAPPALTEAAVGALLAHGPWPRPLLLDPTNNLSGNANAAALGQSLFFDARLSPSGRAACSSCHRPEKAFADPPRRLSRGVALTRRNTPSLLDVRLNATFGWKGSNPTLWQQTIRPIVDRDEMGSSAEHIRAHISADARLAARFRIVTGVDAASSSPNEALVAAAKSIAAYQETITSGITAFDRWRDTLAAGGMTAASSYPATAQRGAVWFATSAGCSACHSGPAFSDGRLHSISRRGRTRDPIRTPPLRNVSHTAPYLHDGRAVSLLAAIRSHDDGLRLGETQAADIVSFLRTLDAR